MEALAVVKHLNKIEAGLTGFGSGFEVATVDQFVFEGAPKSFHGGIVVTVGFAAHGGDGLCVLESVTIIETGVLDAAIRMKDQACGRLTLGQGHAPSGQDQFGIDVLAHGPAGQSAAVKVKDARQINPAFVGGDISDVTEPDLVGGRGCRQRRQAIGGDGLVMVAIRGADPEAAFGAAPEALLTHQAGDWLATIKIFQ